MTTPATSAAPTPQDRRAGPRLTWPPPGTERLQGGLWRLAAWIWMGSAILVPPLIWALGTRQPFWSLGPLEDQWRIGVFVAIIGMVITLIAFYELSSLLRAAAAAARVGYGTLTILEVLSDPGRDTGFLIQGKRHFSLIDAGGRSAIVRARYRGISLILCAGLWFVIGFALAVVLAARGFITPSGTWLITTGPTGLLLVLGTVLLVRQSLRVHGAKRRWSALEEGDQGNRRAGGWVEGVEEAGEAIILGSGPFREEGRFNRSSLLVLVLFVLAMIPITTVTITATLGPALADIAIPEFLSVQEMAGAAEVLRAQRLPVHRGVTPRAAGTALHNLAFVGIEETAEEFERRPETRHEEPWFTAGAFPDQFSETLAADMIRLPLNEWGDEVATAMRHAASHPAQVEFAILAHAPLTDIAGARFSTPFPSGTSFRSLPWPHFDEIRLAAIAHLSKAAVEIADGQEVEAELTIRELISVGFVLVDDGPTLMDNLMGVVLVNMGGDALEAFYGRVGREAEAESLAWAREAARGAAKSATAGDISHDVRSLLRGIPDLVENEAALRGLRWEYLATFNMLAPCINLHKMVFGPDRTYADWRLRVRESLVRVDGERHLFELAGPSNAVQAAGQSSGFLPRLLSLVLGSQTRPGSCAGLISSLEQGGSR